MAVIRNTASALRKGKVGNETYYVSLNKQIVRVAQNDSNYGESASRTTSQQSNRVKWANLVNFYKISSAWMRKAFETKQSNQTDYNRFMQLNLSQSRIYLTREAAQAGAIVADRFAVSQGSLRSIAITQVGTAWATDIRLGTLTISGSTTVAQLTAAILANNSWAVPHQQISFISYQQSTDPFGFPKAVCTAYELTLSNEDDRIVRDLLPDFCSTSVTGGFLGTNDNISVGAFAYVLSQTKGGKTLVSTQTLITNNDLMISQYSSDLALQRAIDSYGVTADAFLDSGSYEIQSTPQPLYITSVAISGSSSELLPNGPSAARSTLSNKEATFKLSTKLPSDVTLSKIYIVTTSSTRQELASISIAESRREIKGTILSSTSNVAVDSFEVILSSGTIDIVFDNSGTEHD